MNAAATAHATAGRPLSSRYHSSPHSPLVISEKQLIVAIVVAPLFHPNVYPSGEICLSLLSHAWTSPALTIKKVLLGIQTLLDQPNISNNAQMAAHQAFRTNREHYDQRVRHQMLLLA